MHKIDLYPVPSVHHVLRVVACCDLGLWPFCIPKSNQHIYEPKYICDQNWVTFPLLVFEIWCSQIFQDSQTHSRSEQP